MQRIWLVAALTFLLMPACARDKELPENLKKGLPGDLQVLQDGCVRADSATEKYLTDVALTYFRSEVGVAVSDEKFGYVSLCDDIYVVPISARTVQVPTSNIWYVEISRIDKKAVQLLRPM